MQSGLPETPYDLERSSLVNIWNINNGPLKNFTQLNSLRGNLAHQLDVRAEKKWIFNKWQLTAYVDIVNIYGSESPSNLPVVNLQRDDNYNGNCSQSFSSARSAKLSFGNRKAGQKYTTSLFRIHF